MKGDCVDRRRPRLALEPLPAAIVIDRARALGPCPLSDWRPFPSPHYSFRQMLR